MNDSLDDLLDARLRDETPYIDDAGFTARVMKQLPRRSPIRVMRSAILFAAALLSVVVAYFASGEGSFVREGVARVVAMPPRDLLVLAVMCGLLTTGAAFWTAFNRMREPEQLR